VRAGDELRFGKFPPEAQPAVRGSDEASIFSPGKVAETGFPCIDRRFGNKVGEDQDCLAGWRRFDVAFEGDRISDKCGINSDRRIRRAAQNERSGRGRGESPLPDAVKFLRQ